MQPLSTVQVVGATRAEAVFALEHFLPYRLSVLMNTMSRAFARRYGEQFGLSIPEWRVMAVLGRFAPLSAGEVAQRTAMDKVRVSRAVAKLMKSGLVDRATDSGDRRRSALKLSRAGRRVHEAIIPMARQIEAALLARLSPQERAALDVIVAKLTERAAALDRGEQA
jgi:DNA-binding MarR family transcriptional regulator